MPPTGERTLRADAQRNRDRLLEVAARAFAAGGDATLEAIAREAGVGIGTLYRRFPERDALMRAVVLAALGQSRHAAEAALNEEKRAFNALVRYLHAVVDTRV